MGIATKLGFVIGEKYTVINDPDGDCEVGEVLIFSDDDGSHYPFFENTDGKEVCCYLSAFMTLPQKGVKSEFSVNSIEGFIQKRNEAKASLAQAQKELDEKLESLGLQEVGESVSPVSENFDWVEADWKEFNVGDEIKVVGDAPNGEATGVIVGVEDIDYDGDLPLRVEFNPEDYSDWPFDSTSTFYKKVTK